jgi:hypothetical protein
MKKELICKKNLLLFLICIFLFSVLVLAEPPQITLINKSPADINTLNLYTQKLVFIYNITDSLGLNDSSVFLYYKTNSTSSNVMYYINGQSESGFFSQILTKNLSTYTTILDHMDVYPTVGNLNDMTFEQTTHSYLTLTNNAAVKIELLDISNLTDYNVFMFMANSTIGASPLYEFYCNSSYVSGRIDTNSNCYQFGTLNSTQTYPDIENYNEQYQYIGLTINPATGMIGTVRVTPASSFILRRGVGTGSWYVYYINNNARNTATETTKDNGASWLSQSYTFDAHLHQYNGADTFYYYACANDTLGNQTCTSIGTDLLDLGGLNPSVPHVYSPTNGTYSGMIPIKYVQAISPNGYNILDYNISLLDSNGKFYKEITDNSQNLFYSWNSSSVVDGNYIIKVIATDSRGQTSFDLSEPFILNNYNLINNILIKSNNGLFVMILAISAVSFIVIIFLIIFLVRRRKFNEK